MRIHKILLFLFVTCLVMNPMTFNEVVFFIGKWGKLFIAVMGILVLQQSALQFNFFLKKYKWLLFFWVLCVFFTIVRSIDKGFNLDLIQYNLLFFVFIYFLFLLSLAFQKKHRMPNFYFFKYLADAININFVLWSAIALLFSFDLWFTLEDRTGLGLFYDSYIQFGIFACVGAIVNFALLRYKKTKNRKLHLFFFALYTLMVILANSRNSEFILAIFLVLNLFPLLKRFSISYTYVIITVLILLGIFYFSKEMLLNDIFIDFTTGRSAIWYYILEYYAQRPIIFGEGIFGLNSTILEDNMNFNYYFQRLDFLYFHSSYLEIFCASGIFGFLFFIVFLVKKLREKKKLYITVIMISVLLGGLFESFLVQPTILVSFLFWYLIIQPTPVATKKITIVSQNNSS